MGGRYVGRGLDHIDVYLQGLAAGARPQGAGGGRGPRTLGPEDWKLAGWERGAGGGGGGQLVVLGHQARVHSHDQGMSACQVLWSDCLNIVSSCGYPPDCTREVYFWVAERALEADGRGVVRRGVHGDVEHGAGQTLHRVRRAQRRHLTGPPPAAVTCVISI